MGEAQRVAVFVPACNEAATLEKILQGIVRRADRHLAALVVVDDGSKDATAEVARKCLANLPGRIHTQVLRMGVPGSPCGNGTATRAALRYIRDLPNSDRLDSVIRIDGDGQHDPEMIGHFIAAVEEGADLVFGSRFHPQSDVSQAPLNRRLINESVADWLTKTTGITCTDGRTGYWGARWQRVLRIIDRLKCSGYGVPIEFFLRLWHDAVMERVLLSYRELPIAALYGADLQDKLQDKWSSESADDQAARMARATWVYLKTCADLEITNWMNGKPPETSVELDDLRPDPAAVHGGHSETPPDDNNGLGAA